MIMEVLRHDRVDRVKVGRQAQAVKMLWKDYTTVSDAAGDDWPTTYRSISLRVDRSY